MWGAFLWYFHSCFALMKILKLLSEMNSIFTNKAMNILYYIRWLAIQSSIRPSAVWCVLYMHQLLNLSWHTFTTDCSVLFDLEIGFKMGLTGWQGVFTRLRYLIPTLVYPEARVCPTLGFVFPTDLWLLDWLLFVKYVIL
jgi:hypothetical protein